MYKKDLYNKDHYYKKDINGQDAKEPAVRPVQTCPEIWLNAASLRCGVFSLLPPSGMTASKLVDIYYSAMVERFVHC